MCSVVSVSETADGAVTAFPLASRTRTRTGVTISLNRNRASAGGVDSTASAGGSCSTNTACAHACDVEAIKTTRVIASNHPDGRENLGVPKRNAKGRGEGGGIGAAAKITTCRSSMLFRGGAACRGVEWGRRYRRRKHGDGGDGEETARPAREGGGRRW